MEISKNIRRLSKSEISQYDSDGFIKNLPVFSERGVEELQIFFNELNIPKPKYFLNIKSKSVLMESEHTGRMMISLEPILLKEIPNRLSFWSFCSITLNKPSRC